MPTRTTKCLRNSPSGTQLARSQALTTYFDGYRWPVEDGARWVEPWQVCHDGSEGCLLRGNDGFKRTWWGGRRFDRQVRRAEREQYKAVRRHDDRDEVTKYFADRELTAFVRAAQQHPGVHPAPPFIEVLAAVALVPFVSAVASTLGTRLSSSIEEAVVTILQRVPRPAVLHIGRRLRGLEPEAVPREENPTVSAPLTVTADGGARIQISSSTPVEALAILVGIDFSGLADLGDVPATVRWIGSQWNAASVQDGTIIDVTWDPETQAWQRYFQS